jgi:hypothetical protein
MATRAILVAVALLFPAIIFAQTRTVPFRFGVFPGVSTQGAEGDWNSVSNVSINFFGGVTGGVNGVELATLFNIDKGNVQFVQAAGLFNVVGGNMRGVQSAGLFNYVHEQSSGVQAAGLYNHSKKDVKGVQAGGIANFSGGKVSGVQAAGIANFSGGTVGGVQAAGILNVAKRVKGLQVGLINLADTSEGLQLGLINITRRGYHKVYVSANEIMNANIAVKTGNPKLYSILVAGMNPKADEKIYSYGFGLGREIKLGNAFTLNPEISSQYLYLGNWHYDNWLSKVQLLVNVRLAKNIAITGGPSFAMYYSDQTSPVKGYKFDIPSYHSYELWNKNWKGWIGWSAGLTFF